MTQEGPKWVARPDRDLEDLIPSFLENRRNELIELERAVGAGDFDFVRRLAHTLKGICRPYGFLHLEDMSRRLEAAGEAEDAAKVGELLGEIRSYVQAVQVVFED